VFVPLVKTVVRILGLATLVLALFAVPAFAVKPRNTQQPSIFGTPIVGETLYCENGGWAGAPSFTYQWVRDDVPIDGATKNSYVLVDADALPVEEGTPDPQIACVVTGRNAEGVASRKSNSTAVVLVRPNGGNPVPDKIKVSDVVTLPSAKKCVRFRRLSFKTRRPSGAQITGLTFFLNNKPKTVFDTSKLGASVSLSNLAKSSTIKVQIEVKNGPTVVGTRKYKMCKHD
jgi:hypothetical protein